jgi:hypothetical protein
MICLAENYIYPLISLILFVVGIVIMFVNRKNKNKIIWSIILIVLAFILFFSTVGICDGHPIIPHRCIVNREFTCENFEIISNNGYDHSLVYFNLSNAISGSINFSDFVATTTDGANTKCIISPNEGKNIKEQGPVRVSCEFDKPFKTGVKYKIIINGTYASGLTIQNFVGSIYTGAK